MSTKLPIFYLDACLFIHLIEGGDMKDAAVNVFEKAVNAECEIYTSIVTVVEIAYCKSEKDNTVLSNEALEKIENLWGPSSPVKIMEVSEFIAREARTMIRQAIASGKGGMKSHDAIHVASARHIKAQSVFTYDKKMLGYNGDYGIEICKPSMPFGQMDFTPDQN